MAPMAQNDLANLIQLAEELVVNRKAEPTVHENCFIQVPLNPDRTARLHVWPDGPLQRQATVNTIHDHRFDFESYVLTGYLQHIEYDWTPSANGSFLAYFANTCGELEREWYGELTRRSYAVFARGSHYTFKRGLFHDSNGLGLTATIMVKRGNDPAITPRIICPRTIAPDNAYDRTVQDPDLVWGYLDRAIARIYDSR